MIECRASRSVRLGHALDVEQRRQLLREAVDQVDFAIEVQDLGTERLALHFLRHQVLEQRRDGPRRLGSAHPPERCPVVLHGVARRRGRPRHLAGQEAAIGVFDGHASADRRGDGVDDCPGTAPAADQLAQADAAHRPSTSRAFISSASGSKGLVM